jgi:hypothetical protein
VIGWCDDLAGFLRCIGPRPIAPLDGKQLKAGYLPVDAESWIEYDHCWWKKITTGVKGSYQ